MDQTPIPFEFLSGQTYNITGENTIWIKASKQSGWDKQQRTVQLTVFADGVPRVKPLVFFRGKGTLVTEKKEYDPRVVVKFNHTAYANSENMVQWIDEQLVPVLNNQPTLLAIDLFTPHKTDDVIDTFLAHDIRISWIPGGCIGLVQPLDVSINRPFKDILHEILEEWLDKMQEEEDRIEAAGVKLKSSLSAIGRHRVMTTWAVGEAWERFSAEKQHITVKAFRVVGLSLPIDGSCNTDISIKGLETATIVEGLKDWSWRGLDSSGKINHVNAIVEELDDDNNTVDFEAGFLRHLV